MRVHEAFRKVALANPSALAIRAEGIDWTYGDLKYESDRFAAGMIRESRLGPGLVPIHVWPGVELAVMALGAMKAGQIAAHIPYKAPATFDAALKGNPIYNDGAWLAFTSGSTGNPKAVVHSHRGIIAQAKADAELFYRFQPGDKIGMYRDGLPLMRAMFAALLSGTPIVIGDVETAPEWINEEKITHLPVTATGFRWLMSTREKFPSVKMLSVGGEMVGWDDFGLFKYSNRFSDDCRFTNRYNCSETIGTITRLELTKDQKVGEGRMPVGYPMPGVEVKIVDSEIVVSHPALCIEYWNDPDLTHQKITVNGDGRRWYRTGDKGYFKDGILYHEGRI